MPPSSISMALAASRQAAAIGCYGQSQAARPAPAAATPATPITPAKPQGTGLLIDRRI